MRKTRFWVCVYTLSMLVPSCAVTAVLAFGIVESTSSQEAATTSTDTSSGVDTATVKTQEAVVQGGKITTLTLQRGLGIVTATSTEEAPTGSVTPQPPTKSTAFYEHHLGSVSSLNSSSTDSGSTTSTGTSISSGAGLALNQGFSFTTNGFKMGSVSLGTSTDTSTQTS